MALACLAVMAPARAQTPAPGTSTAAQASTTPPPATNAPAATGSRTDQRIERIRIEDAGSRIDELRVGGETQSITVAPKGGMPAYDIVPDSGNRGPATLDRNNHSATGGTRVWKILGF